MGGGTDGLSLDRRHYDTAEAGGVDPPFGEARCGLLPHQGRPVAQLGGRHEGKNRGKGIRLFSMYSLHCLFKRKVIVNKGTVHMVKNTNMHCLDCSLLSCRRLKSYLSMPTGV